MSHDTTSVVSSAVAALLALAAAGTYAAPTLHHPEKPTYKYEKCYGVAQAGQNDCFTATSACAATTKQDGQRDAWIYLPTGTCDRIVGGSLDPNAPREDGRRS